MISGQPKQANIHMCECVYNAILLVWCLLWLTQDHHNLFFLAMGNLFTSFTL